MATYRVTYEGYIEGEYDSAEKAKEDFVVALTEDIEDSRNIVVEEFDEETESWK